MAKFEIAYLATSKLEGGYSNHGSDNGGETYKGIARNKNPNWIGWSLIDKAKKGKSLDLSSVELSALNKLVRYFYQTNYWEINLLDKINNQKIADKLYDIGVNMGTGFAAKTLQRVLNVMNQKGRYYPDLKVDGRIGPATISAVNKHPNPENIFKGLNVIQGAHYIYIGESKESQEDFLNGWFDNRIAGIVNNQTENMA